MRELAELDGVDLRAGNLVRDRAGDGPGPGAQVHHLGMRHALRQPVNHQLHHGFRFRPGNEHSRPDGQFQVAEMRDAGDVLQRNAPGPLGDELLVALRRRRVAQHQGAEPAEPDAEQVLGEEFGVDPGTRDAGGGQDGGGLADRVREAQPGSFCHHGGGPD